MGVHFNILLLTGLLTCLPSTCGADNSRDYVPALGRSIQIGDLYNAQKEEFVNLNVFKNSQYIALVTESQNPRSKTKTTTSTKFTDISELLGIDTDTAASTLAGWLKKEQIGGAAEALKGTMENQQDVAGTVVYTHQTVEQSLPLLFDSLKDFYNTEILANQQATHIVSGIKWGGSLSITFRDAALLPQREDENIRAALSAEFLKLQSTARTSDKETFNFKTVVNSDITLPNIELSSTGDVWSLINEFSNGLQNLNGGKGVPIMYRLTPLSIIQTHMNIVNSTNTQSHSITTFELLGFVRIFEDISNSQHRLDELYADVSSKQNCIRLEDLEKIKELRSNLTEYKGIFNSKFKQILYDVRTGTQPITALTDLAQEFNAGHFNSKTVTSKLAKLNDALKKFEFCKTIEKSEGNIEYFGSRQDLLSIIFQNSDKNIYLFFTKTEFAKKDPIKYTENLNYFLNTLQAPNNKLMIVDCDFIHDFCTNVSEPTIYEFKNNHLSSTDFKRTVHDVQMNLQEQINELKNDLTALRNITDQFKLELCALKGCKNGATCNPSADVLSFACTCRDGYTGALCEQDIDECARNSTLCHNGATCQNTNGSFTCSCPLFFTGVNCQILPDCLRNNDCVNGATCKDEIDSNNEPTHTCLCADGFVGQTCSCTLGSSEQSLDVASLKVVKITECGGTIKFPDIPATLSFLLDYKPNETDITKERQCLWTLDSTRRDKINVLKVRVTLLCDDFDDSSESLSVLGWKDTGSEWTLSQNLLTKQAPKYEPDEYDYKLFLNYVSPSNVRHSSGFILRIDVLYASGMYGSNFGFKTPGASQVFGPYRYVHLFTMTVAPPQTSFTLTVDYLDSKNTGSCEKTDVLYMYEIKSVESYDKIANLCGNITSPVSYTSNYPIVILYYTRESTTGRGFSLSWEY